MDAVYLNGAKRRPVLLVAAVVLLLSVALAIGAPSVFAQVIEEGVACMEDTAGFGLQCTAEDIKIAGVYDLSSSTMAAHFSATPWTLLRTLRSS